MAAPQASSRLELLQARFQQKQLQEKEQKLLQLYDQQQQRAYQVVQRGSPGSNNSSHSTSISQHTVTRTSSSSHTTSTSQGGKVRQMFDERRQTTVKGIDRSYPLEPLENKPRKQTNGNGVQKNGILTVNRQSVTVKRVARADVNSNLNGGKPVVSYHEEITRDSFGPSARQQQDEDEFGNENHVAQYANGNHRNQTHIEEVLDEDTIERNRMMAKLHLMEYDETLKRRVKNDLESEEFPEDFMVDVPDKLPKQSVTKKLSPAEARLERFKNANAKRSSNVTKNQTTLPKKRTDPIYPAKSTTSEDRMVRTGTRKVGSRRSNERNGKLKSKTETVGSKEVKETMSSSDSERNFKTKDDGLRFFCKEAEKSATTYAIDSTTVLSNSESTIDRGRKRKASPKISSVESNRRELSSQSLRNAKQQRESPRFFCKEIEKSATAYEIDSKSARKFAEVPKNRTPRDASPKFFCKESEKSATTYAIDFRSRSTSPDFVKITKSAGTTTDSKNMKSETDSHTVREILGIDTVDRQVKSRSETISRSPSPKVRKDYVKSEKQRKPKSVRDKTNVFERLTRQDSSSPQFFSRENKTSSTMSVHAKDSKFPSKSLEFAETNAKKRSGSRKMSSSRQDNAKSRSPELGRKVGRKSSASPQFYTSDSERSASVLMVTPETIAKPRVESPAAKRRGQSPSPYRCKPETNIPSTTSVTGKTVSEENRDENSRQFIRSSVSRFFSEQCEKALREEDVDTRNDVQSTEADKKLHLSRGSSPLSLKDMRTPSSTGSEFYHGETGKPVGTRVDRRSSSRDSSPRSQKIVDTGSETAELFGYESEKSGTAVNLKARLFTDATNQQSGSPSPVRRNTDTITLRSGSPKSAGYSTNTITLRSASPKLVGYSTDTITVRSRSPKSIGHHTDTIILRAESPNSIGRNTDSVTLKSGSPKLVGHITNKISLRSGSPKSIGRKTDTITLRSNSPKSVGHSTDTITLRSDSPKLIEHSIDSITVRSRSPKSIGHHRDTIILRAESPNSIGRNTDRVTLKSGSPKLVGHITNKISLRSGSPKSIGRNTDTITLRSNSPKSVGHNADTITLRSDSPKSMEHSIDSITVRSRSPKLIKTNTSTIILRSGSPKTSKQKISNGLVTTKSKNFPNEPKIRSSKSPDYTNTTGDNRTFGRKGSENVLRSTKLIRDAIKSHNVRNQGNYAPLKHTKEPQSFSTTPKNVNEMLNDSKQRVDEEFVANRKVEKRVATPAVCELPTKESSLKSSTSMEVDAEIQEITMQDQYVKQEHLQGTCSRSSNRNGEKKSNSCKLFAYSVPKLIKKRSSLLESNVFQSSTKSEKNSCNVAERKQRNSSSLSPTNESVPEGPKNNPGHDTVNGKGCNEILKSREQTPSPIRTNERKINLNEAFDVGSNKKKHNIWKKTGQNRWSSSPSPTNESHLQDSKQRTQEITLNRRTKSKASENRKQTSDLLKERKASLKKILADESKKCKTPPHVSKRSEILRSMELVRRAMKDSNIHKGERARKFPKETSSSVGNEERMKISRSASSSTSTMIEIVESSSNIASAKENASSSKNYERTDSVESALRRFDSIGAESVRSTSNRSKESIAKERQTESNKSERSGSDSKTISLKALDQPNVNLRGSPQSKQSRTPSGKTSSGNGESFSKRTESKTRESRCGKKIVKARDSIEIARIVMRSKSPACKRKLFQDDSDEDTDTGSSRSRSSLDSSRTVERCSSRWSNKNETPESVGTVSTQFEFIAVDESSRMDEFKTEETSTGGERSLSVKQLRSIEDIRKSIESESLGCRGVEISGKSAIAKNAARRLDQRRMNIDDRAGSGREIFVSGRAKNVASRCDDLGCEDRQSVKCSMRFSRVMKSPSPEATKEAIGRTRKNVPVSPSKSPETGARRPSTELKAQDTKSTKRPTPMKGTEPIGNRKTTAITTTRKSTDVVDGAILENGLHSRDQTAETKYDNDSPATKKSDAFVIDFDEQPPKENDAPTQRKSLLRKQSTEKQVPSTQSTRPPSSVSSMSSGSSMQNQTSGSKSRMSSRVKTPVSKSGSNKSAGNLCGTDQLVPCKMCGRRFAHDRVTLHERICAKTGQKKRKQYDTMLHRVRGTELEQFARKALSLKKQPEKSKKPEVKSNWRRKHEDFINAIRSAKQVQAHLAAGGKLSDLPPPPVSDNCDYIQCPHCGRKFNQAAAERHIPKCEHMLHNKPLHVRAPKPKR